MKSCQWDRAFELDSVAFLFIFIGADQERASRCHFAARLIGTDAFDFCHVFFLPLATVSLAVMSAQGKAQPAPCLEASGERPNPLDPPAPQEQRHPGAAGLVGSRAVKHDVTVPGDFLVAPVELLRVQAEGAR